MLKIKINEIIQQNQDYTPQGKNYTVYSWVINGVLQEDNGQHIQLHTQQISTLSSWVRDQFKPGSVWGVVAKNVNGMTIYNITDKKPQTEYSGRAVKKVHVEKFDMLARHCWELSKELTVGLDGEDAVSAFDKILGCASIMVDTETMGSNLNNQINQANQSLDQTLSQQEYYASPDDEDIPF